MVYAIIVAAGRGERMGGGVRKQYLTLAGTPVLGHALLAFDQCPAVDRMVLVIPADDMDDCGKSLLPSLKLRGSVSLAAGGPERQDSVYNGLMAIADAGPVQEDSIVVIHDGARPFISPDIIGECVAGARSHGACITAVPASDTLKRVDESGNIESTVPRDTIWLAQTPQAFLFGLIKKAHEDAAENNFRGTDDASLVERMGREIRMISGSRYNIKITTKEDFELARIIHHHRQLTVINDHTGCCCA